MRFVKNGGVVDNGCDAGGLAECCPGAIGGALVRDNDISRPELGRRDKLLAYPCLVASRSKGNPVALILHVLKAIRR